MTAPENDKFLVRGVQVSGSKPGWTLLGTTEDKAAQSVRSVQTAAARLNAWSKATMAVTTAVEVVTARRILDESVTTKKGARQINGVSKALSPEYREMFCGISEDFISVETSLIEASSKSIK